MMRATIAFELRVRRVVAAMSVMVFAPVLAGAAPPQKAAATSQWFDRLQAILAPSARAPKAALNNTQSTWCGLDGDSTLDDVMRLWGKPTGLEYLHSWTLNYGGSIIHVDEKGYFVGCKLDARTPGVKGAKIAGLGLEIGVTKKKILRALKRKFGVDPYTYGYEENAYRLFNVAHDGRVVSKLTFELGRDRNKKRAAAILAYPLALRFVALIRGKKDPKPSDAVLKFDGVKPRVLGVDDPTLRGVTNVWGRPTTFNWGMPETPKATFEFGWENEFRVEFGKKATVLQLGGTMIRNMYVLPKGLSMGIDKKAIIAGLGAPKAVRETAVGFDLLYRRAFSKHVSVSINVGVGDEPGWTAGHVAFTWHRPKPARKKR